ncbi:hypothetical protein SAMN05878482_1095 [Peribacillus simplex]|uniref:Uncharacterized protein n=1 Tax=Peribacillus simplex TaxID=1478 RepID=A0A9X8RDI8_9BACI|nr:hypothetical protein [Peribacillus simplex]SIS01103.1 hypothetical protein SAMN05878482_1095 [Peribacillus simplex]
MAVVSFSQRLTSNTNFVRLGADRAQAAFNAANGIGVIPDAVARHVNPPTWPSLKKFDNDNLGVAFSPLGGSPDPQYIWDLPTADGQSAAFAIASNPLTIPRVYSVFLNAFADNAMKAKIELFELIDGSFVKAAPQPAGLDEFLLIAGDPNNPAVGLTINDPPFTFQDNRVYSTIINAPAGTKIVVSFEVANYLIQPQYASNPSSLNNPAGLQFIVDIYGFSS